MLSVLSSLVRTGVIAVAALAVTPVAVPAAPIGPAALSGANTGLPLIKVESRANNPGAYNIWPRVGRGSQSRPNNPYRVGPPKSRPNRIERHRPDRYVRRHRHYRGPGIILNFGVPAYRYRPHYRAGYASSAHVRWCYARYRSYREWDNTYQPYHGPRRQCISPYI